MSRLVEAVGECIKKDSSSVLSFLERMIKRGKLNAFLPGKCEQPIPVNNLQERGTTYVIQEEESGTKYIFWIDSYGGAFSQEGDQTQYSSLYLKKINRLVSIGNLCGWLSEYGNNIPEPMISCELNINSSKHYEAGENRDYLAGESKTLTILGKKDKLFKKVRDFAKN